MRSCSASSIVGAITTVHSDVLLIVPMSRPTSAQWPASTSSLRGSSSKPEVKLAISACSAIRRSVFFSPWPPIMIGGPPGVTGAGELMASFTE